MSQRLDFNRDYGIVTPPYRGAVFDQDGACFGQDGEFLFRHTEAATVGDVTDAGALAPVSDPSESTEGETPVQDDAGNDGSVDLIAWAKNEVKYPFYAVKKAAKAAMPDADVSSAKAVANALIEAGLIPAEDVAK